MELLVANWTVRLALLGALAVGGEAGSGLGAEPDHRRLRLRLTRDRSRGRKDGRARRIVPADRPLRRRLQPTSGSRAWRAAARRA